MRNVAQQWGGGISWEGPSWKSGGLSRCVIAGNRAGSGGGIVLDAYSVTVPLTVRNCLVLGNTARSEGGGVSTYVSGLHQLLTFDACTFAGNSAESGGGVSCLQGNFLFHNCIVWGNMAIIGPQIFSDNPNSMPPFTDVDIYYCDLEGGAAGVHGHYGWGNGIFFREGNIDSDPCFADPYSGDYHLKSQGGRWDANEGRWTR